jgi:hypothetical protein
MLLKQPPPYKSGRLFGGGSAAAAAGPASPCASTAERPNQLAATLSAKLHGTTSSASDALDALCLRPLVDAPLWLLSMPD